VSEYRSKCKSASGPQWAVRLIGMFVVTIALSAVPSIVRAAQTPFLGVVAPPVCQAGDRIETGVDGQLTLAERSSGASTLPYNCNLQIVGQYQGQGAGHQLMWNGNCAYYTTPGWAPAGGYAVPAGEPAIPPLLHNGGTQVIDVSDPTNPTWVGHLIDPLYSWETPSINHTRQILAEAESWSGGGPQPAIDLYDVSDCANPKPLFQGMFNDPHLIPHGGNIAPDGNTYYVTSISIHYLNAIDISDPTNPKVLLDWNFPNQPGSAASGQECHRIEVNQFPIGRYAPGDLLFCGLQSAAPYGFGVYDVSQVQNREPNPVISLVGTYFWPDGETGIEPQLAVIGGKPFVTEGSEDGSASTATAACAEGLSPYGYYRLFNVSKPSTPVLTAKLMLQVDAVANCSLTENDIGANDGGYGYSSHDVQFDNPLDAKLLALSCHQCGVRVFDIHNPYAPRELAYFKGPAPPVNTEIDPGSLLTPAQGVTPPVDFAWTKSHSRFVWQGQQLYLWVISSHGGFYVLKFEPNVMTKILALNPVPTPGNEDFEN
jgi:hypothetical protein